jgi:putative flippase GtrA
LALILKGNRLIKILGAGLLSFLLGFTVSYITGFALTVGGPSGGSLAEAALVYTFVITILALVISLFIKVNVERTAKILAATFIGLVGLFITRFIMSLLGAIGEGTF